MREHLGYEVFDRTAAAALSNWLGERAVEHEAPRVRLALACETYTHAGSCGPVSIGCCG